MRSRLFIVALCATLVGVPALSQDVRNTYIAVAAQIADGVVTIAKLGGLGTGVGTALGTNVGSVGAPVVNGGALGTPSSGVGTNITNVNAATLGGATFAAPGTIGGGTPGNAVFNSTKNNNELATVGQLGGALVASAGYLDISSGLFRIFATGANAATRGTIDFRTLSSDASQGNVATFQISSIGGILMHTLTTAAGTPNSICQDNATKEIVVNAALTCTVSSLMFKHDFAPIHEDATAMLMAMQPGSFFYNDNDIRQRFGFGAEYVAAVDRRLADGWGDDGKPRSIDQNAILAVTVKAFQELKADNDNLRARLERLEKGGAR